MDSQNKHVEQISFRQCVAFCEHGQLKGWQPRFQPTAAKISILAMVLPKSLYWTWQILTRQLYESMTKPFAPLYETGFYGFFL